MYYNQLVVIQYHMMVTHMRIILAPTHVKNDANARMMTFLQLWLMLTDFPTAQQVAAMFMIVG